MEHHGLQAVFNSAVSKKWAALAVLIILQVAVGVVYKLSQKSSARYSYSTFSALAIAEAIKLCISAGLLARIERKNHAVIPVTQNNAAPWPRGLGVYLKILTLAIAYCVNNQLMFAIYLSADPASINMFKSGSSLITAVISCVLLGRIVTLQQWAAIILQVCGLFVTQYDACRTRMVLPETMYLMLLILVSISALCGVWNEQQLKTLPLTLRQQNMVLYAGGLVFNVCGHALRLLLTDSEPGFFSGYDAASIAVVAVNACYGTAVNAVYMYADSIMKCLANAVTTVLLLGFSWLMFGLQLQGTSLAGCVTVVVAVGLYATTAHESGTVASARYRGVVASTAVALCTTCFVGARLGVGSE